MTDTEKDEALSGVAIDPMVSELLEKFSRSHAYCDDCFYTCPKHPEGCCNKNEGDECNCGADRYNAALRDYAYRLQARLSR